jgi:hypothetical protein
MKRSELVKALQEWIKRCDYPCSAWEFVEQADGIIKFLESQGMQPPKIEQWEEISGTFLGEGFKVMKMVNKWEDEE